MTFEFILVTDKNELEKHKENILKLFHRSFTKELDTDEWQWAYIDNQCGTPTVSLCYSGDRLAGHYAVIPYQLRYKDTSIQACLSMTTMVDPDFRGHGLFIQQANIVYDALPKLGFDFVFGFPNNNSAPGFKKHLQWTINENDFVATATKKELLQSKQLRNYLDRDDYIEFPVKQSGTLDWRLNKPDSHYTKAGNTILKPYDNAFDILYLSPNFNQELDDDVKYNILLDSSIEDLRHLQTFSYQSGYRNFNNDNQLNLKKDLLISDVF